MLVLQADLQRYAVKLVSLAVSSACENGLEPDAPLSFRDKAFWYPDIPPQALSFLGVSDSLHRSDPYQELPICFELCGSLNNEYAHDFKSITVQRSESGYLTSIAINLASTEGAAHLGLQDAKDVNKHEFIIDGSGGEYITGFDTFYAYGTLVGCKVSQRFLYAPCVEY